MGNRGLLLLCLACVLAGCTALPGISSDATPSAVPNGTSAPTGTPVSTGATSTAAGTATGTAAPTGTPTATASAGTPDPTLFTVAYAIRAGAIDDALQSVTVEFDVVFAEKAGDLSTCIGALKSSRYEVTATPLATPAADCRTVTGITVDLAALNGTRDLGPFTAAGRYDGAHALVVRNVVPVYGNGTTVTAVHDVDFRAHTQEGRDPGYYGVEINVTAAASDAPWRYVVSDRTFEPFDVTTPTPTPAPNGTAAANGTATENGTAAPTGTDTAA